MWSPKGVIFNIHHAQLPTPIYIGSGLIRVYYSTKIDGKSHIRFFDIEEDTLKTVNDQDALSPGENFDNAGVMPSCISNGLMYYTGWHLKKDVPYGHAIGVASINKDGTLNRKDSPVLIKDHIVNSPCVEKRQGRWRMLYCKGTGWIDNHPTYHISSAFGDDGFSWKPTNEKVITYNKSDESISRVSIDGNNFYYSWKTKDTSYQLARMSDGKKHELIIEKSYWDSDMQCYPIVYNRDSFRYLFYNGNGYGSTGIGVAKWKTDIV